MNLKFAYNTIKSAAAEFGEDNALRLSAALAYYAIFSIGPLLAIVVGLAGLAFGNDAVRRQIHQALQGMLGESSAKTVDSMISARSHATSLLTTVIGIVALLFGAAGVFGQLQDSLNTIWEVKSKPHGGIWAMVRNRFLSFSMVLGVGFLLLVSLAISIALAAFTSKLNRMLPMGNVLGHTADVLVSFGIVTLLFAMILKFLPDVKIPWSKVWVGAIGTSLLFTLGKFLLGLYLGNQSSAYGAAGSVIVILMWIYYASVILFFGAEFTQVYARQTGAKIAPTKYAVPVTENERVEEGNPRDKTGPAWPPQSGHVESFQRAGTAPIPKPARRMPGQMREHDGFELVWLLFTAGLVAGALFRFKSARRTLHVHGKTS